MLGEETLHDAISNVARRFGIHLMVFAYLQEEEPDSLELVERAAIFSRLHEENIPTALGNIVAGQAMDALRFYADGAKLPKIEEQS